MDVHELTIIDSVFYVLPIIGWVDGSGFWSSAHQEDGIKPLGL